MSASNVLRLAARRLATSAARQSSRGNVPNTPGYQKVQEMQNIMCRDDGLFVWQKLGFRDQVGYQMTMGLMVMTFIPFAVLMYRMSFPKKQG